MLALLFQEPITVVVRLKASGSNVGSAEALRTQMIGLLRSAEAEALQRRYPPEYVHFALYAVVAFLDETAMDSKLPAMADWVRRPLQPEWFKGLIAGRTFFEYLEQLLQSGDSALGCEVLEVYLLCLLLGYSGQFAKDPVALRNLEARITTKISRVRGELPTIAELAAPKTETVQRVADRFGRWLAIGAAVAIVLAVVLFVAYRSATGSLVDLLAMTTAICPG